MPDSSFPRQIAATTRRNCEVAHVWRSVVMVVALLLLALMPSMSSASGCTAMWGMLSTNRLAYFNSTTSQWVTQTAVMGVCGAAGCNALAGRNSNGLLYFVDRVSRNLYTFNPNTGTISASLGVVPVPPPPAAAVNILGGTFDNSDRLFFYATDGAATGSTNSFVVVAQISTTTGATATSWTQVRTTAGATPTMAGSGDMNVGNDGIAYIVSNTNPPTYHQLNLTPGASFGRTNSPSVVLTGADGVAVAAVAVDPLTQDSDPNRVYIGSNSSGSTTYAMDRITGVSTLVVSTTAFNITDMGNCPVPPDPPSVSKSFNPAYISGGTSITSTLVLTFGNTNNAPVWLISGFTDTFPAGLLVGPVPAATTSCSTPGFTIAAGANNIAWAAGGKIPNSPGCSVSLTVTAPASLTAYANAIAAGALSTTAGTNTAGVTATLVVGTDFSMNKQVRAGTTAPLASSASVGVLQTMQYVLTISNSTSGGTGSVTFTDTLPVFATPLLMVTAVHTGGGACSTATATAGGRSVVSGTLTNALAGSTCTVTITARGSATVASFSNTATLAAVASTGDPDASNNSSSATVTLTPIANITVTKTNGLGGTAAAGQVVVYTVTVANLGPSAATPSFLADPAVPGLSCSSVTCSATGAGAACPGVTSTTMAYLQGSGIQLNTFNSANTLTFAITCGITATGLP